MFATHYQELNQLADDFPRIKNYNVSVKEANGKILFMRKLVEGGSNHSFGIQVAQMAGMPHSVVLRANDIMHHLEDKRDKNLDQDDARKALKEMPKEKFQLSMFDAPDPKLKRLMDEMEKVDVNTLSPIQALLKLQELKLIL